MNIARYLRQADVLGFGIAILASLALFGCGGGGSTNTDSPPAGVRITGTAAAGAPVVGFVSVRDSSANPQPVLTNIPIEANGNYSVDVTGLTAPYAFLASGSVGGRSVSLYSAATAADEGGKINITPFTDLMIRNIAATAVDAYLANSANMANLTTANLEAQRATLTTMLTPALTAMGLSGSIDLLRATFNADNTGLDRFMDVVKVDTTTPSAVTITNILDAANTLIVDTTAGGTSSGTLGTANLTSSATPVDSIVQNLNAFSAYFATSLPSPTDPNLVAMLSPTFLDGGRNGAAFLTNLTSSQTMIGMKFTNIVVDSVDLANGTAQIHYSPIVGGSLMSEVVGGAYAGQMKKNANGDWLFNGDQRIASVRVNAFVMKNACNPARTSCTFPPFFATGLHLMIDNGGALPIGSAVVTGPGLPAGGVTLLAQANTWLGIFDLANSNCPTCSTGGNLWYMADTDIAAVTSNSVYTVKLYDNAPTPALLDTYTETVAATPTFNTALSTVVFPSLSGMVDLAGVGATNLPLTWNIPTGLSGQYLGVNAWQSPSGEASWVSAENISGSAGTATLAIAAPSTGTWSGANYNITARDHNANEVMASYQ